MTETFYNLEELSKRKSILTAIKSNFGQGEVIYNKNLIRENIHQDDNSHLLIEVSDNFKFSFIINKGIVKLNPASLIPVSANELEKILRVMKVIQSELGLYFIKAL